jgi:hypothetical protein
MSDEAFAAPTSSQTGAALTPAPANEGDYDAIYAAVMETVRGRWFLSEYSRRNRHADTQLVLVALDRIERGLRGRQTPESVERLRNDLMEMAKAVARAKAEIAGVSPADEADPIGDVSQELDSVVRATEEATSNILAAAAQIQEVAWSMREQGNDASLADQLSAYAATIQTAASSQKLAGERTQKVVDVMRDLEGRINDMIDVWGAYPAVDNPLLANSARNTPALPPADFVQEIDAQTDVEPRQNSSDEHDATLQDLPQATASPEANRLREPRNDNGRARSANGHLVLDPSIAAAIRDAASLTNAAGAEGNAVTTAHVAEAKDTSLASPGMAPHERSGDGTSEPTAPRSVQESRDTQAQDGSHEAEESENSELSVVAEPAAGAAGETTSPRGESATALEVLSEPVGKEEPEEGSPNKAEPNTNAPGARTEAASQPDETTPSARAPEATISHPQAAGGTAAEPDQQLEPLAETQADDATAAVEIPAKPRSFFVIDLDLEPLLPIGFEAPASGDAREISGSAREKEASPTADPKPFGWLSEPVTALYDLPPLEVPETAAPTSSNTHAAAPEVPPTRPSQSGSRWPFAFLAPRLRTKPTATESAPTETAAPPPAVATSPMTNKMGPATPAPAIAFELGGLVVIAPPAVSEARRPAVTAAPQPVASEPSAPAVVTSNAAAVITPAASKSAEAAGAAAAPPEASKLDAPVVADAVQSAPPAPVVAAAPVSSASLPDSLAAAAAAAPTASEPSAAAVPLSASEPVAAAVEASAAASEPGGPIAAAGASAKPAASGVKLLRPSPPPPSDPLAALAALSDEEKLALFS